MVTGGNSGIGRAIALGFRNAGATVAITGRNEERNAIVATELADPEAAFGADVRDEDAMKLAVSRIVERHGRLDILVNNAGNARGGSISSITREDWEDVIGTHLTGAFICSKHASRAMIERGEGGKIINIGSMYSLFGPPFLSPYASAKAGLLGLTRALAVELAQQNIQVNALLPGWFETGMTRGLRRSPFGEDVSKRTPAGRWGEDEDLIGPAVFLASRASNFVTGCYIPVDGGYAVSDRSQR